MGAQALNTALGRDRVVLLLRAREGRLTAALDAEPTRAATGGVDPVFRWGRHYPPGRRRAERDRVAGFLAALEKEVSAR